MSRHTQNSGRKRPCSAIDLTKDDIESERHLKTPRSSQFVAAKRAEEEEEEEEDDDDDDDDDDGNEAAFISQNDELNTETFEHYGTILSKVVGIRYYRGVAARGESVLLRREPQNPYDSNAIQVLNVRGEQIGHVPRQMSAKLTAYLDLGELTLEGVLAGHPGDFDISLCIKTFGPVDPEIKECLKNRMARDKLPIDELKRRDAEDRKKRAAELKKAAKANNSSSKSMQWMNGIRDLKDVTTDTDSGFQTLEDIMGDSHVINPREIGRAAEKFGVQEEDLAKMPEAEQPARLATKLLPYQKQGLAWLLEKEDPMFLENASDDTVQLWKRQSSKGGSLTYKNVATNFTTKQQPTLARGGILADDMGLGKTLEMISLIVADKAKFGDQGPTLIVAPVSVMSNWRQQVARHVIQNDSLQAHVYHGSGRKNMKAADFCQFDIVITTYGTLSTEYWPRGSKSKPDMSHAAGLFSVKWRRLILDEGHTIRNPNTKNALAACSINAHAKWALTGTPIINSLKDFYSLIRFVGLTGGLERFELFNSILIRPLQDGQPDAQLLLQALMGTFCLRRRKDMAFVDLRLPELTEYVHRIKFSEHERQKYNALQEEAKGTLGLFKAEAGKNAQHAYRHLLEILLRLRQVCNHWKLCEDRVNSLIDLLEEQKFVDLTPENRAALQELLQLSIEQREECPVCLETLHNPVITHCGHIFGNECIVRVIETQRKCPMCRTELRDEMKLVQPAIEYGDNASDQSIVEEGDTSAKMQALLSILSAVHKKPGSKVVVFSQWCRFLDIVQPSIKEAGHKVVRLDGGMSATKRDAALRSFDGDAETTVMLASLGVSSVGLNLVAADTVVMCDSWWAPAIEDQAVDRVHRLGQTRPTTVWRLIMEGSVEERTLEIQKDKRQLMATALTEGPEERKRREGGRSRTLGDIQRLLD